MNIMQKEIEQLTEEDLQALWPVIGGAPHLFEQGKEELKSVLVTGFNTEENDPEPISLQLDFYTMAAIVDTLRQRGFGIEAMGEKPELPSNIEELAAKAIPNHPYPDMNYPGDAVTKISRKSWIEGYKEAMGVQPGSKIFTKEDARVLLNNFQEYAQAHEIDPPYSFSTLVNKWIDDYTLLNYPNQEAMGVPPGTVTIGLQQTTQPLPELLELDGVIIKHRPAPEVYGGVGVHTLLGDYAIVKADQERAAKLIGHKVRVKETEYYKTVEILWKESDNQTPTK